jgi:hypothetical protein
MIITLFPVHLVYVEHTLKIQNTIFKCKIYSEQRRTLFLNTRSFLPLSVRKLLFGIEGRSESENEILFKEVQRFN